ncbi:chelated iron ABC transporter, ATP-binding protein [Calothrix parasitica NIES-267]|uniref:Chelated iron ABC transporter, ATP-binding protein n=1 Tax=Calothrix parasitica NIES-267 TaxID=1973488 RepID=A0A1Z4LRS0_9CYAN|nr:chelated iron ABC transporter, ATP-binding protein [Calothrix parasitica NIES-267]
MSKITVQVEDTTVAYNGKVALHEANLQLNRGSISGLVGMNGSGKSTLFKAIMGFVKPTNGHIFIQGMSIKKAQKQNLVAYIPQSEDVDWNFPINVQDVVMMGRYGYMNFLRIPRETDRKAVAESLARTNMSELKYRQIGELSGGQRKRAFVARALAQKAQIILLDEPFAGVDIKTEKALIQLLIELRNMGHTILISTHDLSSISTFCDDVVLINRTILAYGPTGEVFTRENIARTFDGMVPVEGIGNR